MLHIDASGNLVKVHGNVYKRTLNYTFLVKNYSLRDIEESSFQLGEFISSNHDVLPLTIMIMRMKYQFEKFLSKQFNFRIFVCDFSWTLIHSAIESLNQISIIQYANLVMKLANDKLNKERSIEISWLASCMSHTMKRFTNFLKKDKIHGQQYIYACYAFSLLANCTDIVIVKTYYQWIYIIFMSSVEDQLFISNRECLKTALRHRPENLAEYKTLFNSIGINTKISLKKCKINL